MNRLFGWCVLAALFVGCTADGGGRNTVPAPDGGRVQTDHTAQDFVMPPLPRGKVILEDAFGGKHVVDVEIAANEIARSRGMMWRTSAPEGTGMLFIFSSESVHGFWMKNTLIPLDMAFIDADGTIVGIVSNAQPRTLTSRSVGEPSQYVLEVAGGWLEKKGIKTGSRVELQGVSMIPVR